MMYFVHIQVCSQQYRHFRRTLFSLYARKQIILGKNCKIVFRPFPILRSRNSSSPPYGDYCVRKTGFFSRKKILFQKKRLHRKTEMLLRHFCKSISPPFYGVSFGNCVFGVWQYSICLFFESFLLTFRSECCILLFTIFHSFGGIAQLVRAFGSHPKGRGFEPPCVHHIRTKVMIPLVLQLSFFLSKQALFLTISKNNSILFMMSFSHRRLRSVSSGERGARHCAELWCGTATVDIVPP